MGQIIDRLRVFFKPTDIYTSQRLMLYLLICVGLFPFQIAKSRNHKTLAVSWIGYVMSFLFVSFFIACTIVLITYNSVLTVARKTVMTRLATVARFFNLIALMFLIYGSCLCFSKRIRTCMQNIVNIDKQLNFIGVEISYWRGFYFSIFLIWFIIIHFTSSVVMSTLQISFLIETRPNIAFTLWTSFFTQHVSLVTVSLIECFYAAIAFEINERFVGMNRILKCLLAPTSNIESVESTAWNIQNKSEMSDLIGDLCIIHSDLCDTCDTASNFFSLKMLFVIGTAFLCLLVNGYFSIITLLNDDNGLDSHEYVDMTYGLVENVMIASAMAIACNCGHRIAQQNEKCLIYVQKILNTTEISATKNKLLEFSHQLVHRKISFSALGLFSLDRQLLFMIATGISNYLVILIEFSEDQKSCETNTSNKASTQPYFFG